MLDGALLLRVALTAFDATRLMVLLDRLGGLSLCALAALNVRIVLSINLPRETGAFLNKPLSTHLLNWELREAGFFTFAQTMTPPTHLTLFEAVDQATWHDIMAYMCPATLACFLAASSRHFRLARNRRFQVLYRDHWPSLVNPNPFYDSDWSLKVRFNSFVARPLVLHAIVPPEHGDYVTVMERLYFTPRDRSYWSDIRRIFAKEGRRLSSIYPLLHRESSTKPVLTRLNDALFAQAPVSYIELYMKRGKILVRRDRLRRDVKIGGVDPYSNYFSECAGVNNPMLRRFIIARLETADYTIPYANDFVGPKFFCPSLIELWSSTSTSFRAATKADFGLTDKPVNSHHDQPKRLSRKKRN
jgi:hypothetical protein